MKLKLFITLLFLLITVSKASADDGGVNAVPATQSTSAAVDTEKTLYWPAIPGDSLNSIARAFYPQSLAMRRLFVSESLRLNAAITPALTPETVFEVPTLLTIPTLKTLSKSKQATQLTHRTKAMPARTDDEQLNIHDSADKKADNLPVKLLQEYELLVSKNSFLKTELARLFAKIAFLQTTLNDLKLTLDKVLSLPAAQPVAPIAAAVAVNEAVNHPEPAASSANSGHSATKVIKNLGTNTTNGVKTATEKLAPSAPVQNIAAPVQEAEPSFGMLPSIAFAVLGLAALSWFIMYLLKQRRERALNHFNQSAPIVTDDTLTSYTEHWQDTEQGVADVVETQKVPAKNFINTEMRGEYAKAASSLEEAKLLMSINRTSDAIAHLKLNIKNDPKTSINHWLYLLEIFRKLDLKEDFEAYAQSLHSTFNVMTPIWYESTVAIVVPQSLEEFPHIMEKLDVTWPSQTAKEYLRSLVTDNRDGDRVGFSGAVLDEILMLIALLDARKELDAPANT